MRLGGIAVTAPHLNTEAKYNGSRLLTKNILNQPRHRIQAQQRKHIRD